MPGGEACVVLQSVMVRASRDTNFVIIKTKLQPLSLIYFILIPDIFTYTPCLLPPRHSEPVEENSRNYMFGERERRTVPTSSLI